MKTFTHKYKLIDKSNGELIFAGKANECAEFMGIATETFQNGIQGMMRRKSNAYRGYRIEVEKLANKCTSKPLHFDVTKRQAKEWDDFVTPIRERYGIPVYKAGDTK